MAKKYPRKTKKKKRKNNLRMFDFEEQLKIGNVGEKAFIRFYKDLEPTKSVEDRSFDFTLKNGETVELKSDQYENAKNFFMERYSDYAAKKDGGVWRNETHNWFVYFFIKDLTFYWFRPKDLIKFLDIYIQDLAYKCVKNRGYSTIGYCVPKEVLIEFCKRKDEA